MAIIEALPGIQVTVESQGRVLPEYEDDSEWDRKDEFDTPTNMLSLSFIECVTDQEFQIRCEAKPPYKPDSPILDFAIMVDGKKAVKVRTHQHASRIAIASQSAERISPTEMAYRRLKFSNIRKG
jgi:hypothetical protein